MMLELTTLRSESHAPASQPGAPNHIICEASVSPPAKQRAGNERPSLPLLRAVGRTEGDRGQSHAKRRRSYRVIGFPRRQDRCTIIAKGLGTQEALKDTPALTSGPLPTHCSGSNGSFKSGVSFTIQQPCQHRLFLAVAGLVSTIRRENRCFL